MMAARWIGYAIVFLLVLRATERADVVTENLPAALANLGGFCDSADGCLWGMRLPRYEPPRPAAVTEALGFLGSADVAEYSFEESIFTDPVEVMNLVVDSYPRLRRSAAPWRLVKNDMAPPSGCETHKEGEHVRLLLCH